MKVFFKKYLLVVIIFSLLFSFVYVGKQTKKNNVLAVSIGINLDIGTDLEKEIESQIENLDSEEFDDIIKKLGEREKNIYKNQSFFEKLKALISGKNGFSFGDILKLLFSLIVDNAATIIPSLALICAVAIMSSLLLQFRGKSLNKPLGDIIHFACFSIVAVIVLTEVFLLVKLTSTTLLNLKKQMEIAFPILLTLMVSLGAGSSVSIYQPIIAIMCGGIMHLFTMVVLPIFSLCVIFSVIGNLTTSVKLGKLTKFLESTFKYVVGFIFTIFAGFMAVSGIVAGSYDGVSIRATKFAIKSYVPIMGSYLSDGFSLIMASSVLIKNAIGYSGLVIMFLTIISPIIKIILLKLGLSLVAGIIESVADKRVTDFVSGVSKSLTMLSSIILAFSFAYLICVGLLMCSANVF